MKLARRNTGKAPGGRIAYIAAALLSVFALAIVITVLVLKENFGSFPGTTMSKSVSYKDRPFGPPFDQGRPLHGANQKFRQLVSSDLKGTSVDAIDQLSTGRSPIIIEWARNWYNLP